MSASSPGRARGRELALLALCHLESYAPEERVEALAVLWAHPPAEGEPEAETVRALWSDQRARDFADVLLAVVLGHGDAIDAEIDAASRSWRLARMDRVDRNVLRLVVVELGHVPETPRAVVLAEAVRLAGRYGSEHSKRFVNGMADALAERLRPRTSGGGEG